VKTRLLHIWEILTSSYWFIPTLMLALATALAFVMLYFDDRLVGDGRMAGIFYSGGIDGARAVLATVAASVITVAGVVFSITIATLTQASTQFGPRLLRNFMRDTGNQVVLGTFVATFVYSMIVLRAIGREPHGAAVPHASVLASVLLGLASIVVLIYFIHHVSLSLQAPIIVAAVAGDLEQALARVFPSELGHGPAGPAAQTETPELPADFDANAAPVPARKDGYVQVIDQATLMELAATNDLLIRLEQRPGDYVIRGNPVMHVYPGRRCTPHLAEQLGGLLIFGRQRTPEQDTEFAIHQLVEIAVRALSPAVNDPYTAINCIDRLSSALVTIEHGDLHGSYRYDDQRRLRVVARVTTFTSFVDAAFNQIRQYGRESVAVTIRLLDAIAAAGRQMRYQRHRSDLLRHARIVYRQAQTAVRDPEDLADVRERYETAVRVLTGAAPAGEAA
jgi:uncharacterized membrane protein